MVKVLTIEDLSKRSGLSLRTLRYYIQEGLLPRPDTAGKYASYSQQHLDHLEIIQRLKMLHLPLKEIRHLLSNMTPGEMRQILEYQDTLNLKLRNKKVAENLHLSSPANDLSAMEYIRELEKKQNRLRLLVDTSPMLSYPQRSSKGKPGNRPIQEPEANFQTAQERWTKIILSKDIELNIKEKQAQNFKQEIDALITFAAKLFRVNQKEDTQNE